jgi:uncharacterized protein
MKSRNFLKSPIEFLLKPATGRSFTAQPGHPMEKTTLERPIVTDKHIGNDESDSGDSSPLDRAGLLAHIRRQFLLDWDGIHGARHWARVRHHGLRVGKLRGADLLVVELFAFLHDSCRHDDLKDPYHADRAAQFAFSLNGRFFQLKSNQLEALCAAIRGHSSGRKEQDVTIQTCWDADRLDLGRVGIVPRAEFLSAEAAKLILEATAWATGK